MAESPKDQSEFIAKAESVIIEQLSNEQFGVSELAEALGMSRSNLLRKIKYDTKLSASQYIRQVRLKEGMKLLKQSSFTVSEVSYKVGFGSTSYFIKCFREFYGHPPGEVGKREASEEKPLPVSRRSRWSVALILLIVLAIVAFFFGRNFDTAPTSPPEKSIAVLPFKNDSNDSTNLYFVNGLMESALSNLQKIEELRVVSRTSVEKYRNSTKDVQEIAKELGVTYLVEGSGQKNGNQVMLNIQLIEATRDKHVWAGQYNRSIEDIFSIQNEVARKMVDAIKVIVTPEEMAQIEKRPTESIEAYDYYLRALDPYYSRSKEGLNEAIPLFEKAVELDPTFALAYADLAISYFFLDVFKEEKAYSDQINNYADKALLYDSKSDRSLIAKALYYRQVKKFRLALPHLEKALEYNPNSSAAVQMIAEHYALYAPNTSKYLEYALKGIQIDIAPEDSSTRSYLYLQLGNALAQSGFVDDAIKYIDLSLGYDSNNFFTPYARAFILYARHLDLDITKGMLIKEWKKDTSRMDILQEIGKVFYFQKNYDSAFYYYQKFVKIRESNALDIYPYEDGKISLVYQANGLDSVAAQLFESYAAYCERDESIYKSASLAGKHAQEGDLEAGIEQLKLFANQRNFQYWIVLFFEMDPLIEPLKSHPEFDQVMDLIESRFWEDHEELRKTLEGKRLL